MTTFTEHQKAQFDGAVSAFRGSGFVSVTPDKLRAFLEDARDIDTPANRLRLLAIELECANFEQGWSGLRAIYQAAADADPADARVFHSWGISASNWAE